MGRSKRVKVATEELREYANFLQGKADEVDSIVAALDRGRVTLEDWGTAHLRFLPAGPVTSNEGESAGSALRDDFEDLGRVKSSYEAAHSAAKTRLRELQEAERDTAAKLARIAKNYETDEVSSRRAIEGAE